MEALNQGSEVLTDLLEHGDPQVDVEIANALWARKGTQLLETYADQIKQSYDAKVSELDFDDKDAASTINKWVRSKPTTGLIKWLIRTHSDPVLSFL